MNSAVVYLLGRNWNTQIHLISRVQDVVVVSKQSIKPHVYYTLLKYFMETFSAPTNMISSVNVKKINKMCFISEAEEALLINLSEDCKYMSPLFRLCAWFPFQQKNHIPWKTHFI